MYMGWKLSTYAHHLSTPRRQQIKAIYIDTKHGKTACIYGFCMYECLNTAVDFKGNRTYT